MPEIHKINDTSISTIFQPGINTGVNLGANEGVNEGVNVGVNVGGNITVPQRTREIPPDEFFRREKRKNHGLIEKLYNQIKNVTGLGVGTKKVKRVIEASKLGKASSEDVINTVNK